MIKSSKELHIPAKKANPRDATARIVAQARKRADAEIMAEIRKLKTRVKALEQALSK